MWRPLVAALIAAWPAAALHAQVAGRLLDAVDVSERPGRVDVSLIFGCSMRYVSHAPMTEGDSVRVRFAALPDCGDLSRAVLAPPPGLGGTTLIRAIEVDAASVNAVDITVRFAASHQFVLAPTSDSRGLRLRVLGVELDRSRVFVGEPTTPLATYAVNLESSPQPPEQSALEEAARITGVPAYASEFVLGDQKWYRLRVGPFASESAARKVLSLARSHYPKAWLAIGDDETLTTPGAEGVTPSSLPTRPQANATLTPKDLEATFDKAKKAFNRKDYATAIPLLTKLLEQPEFPRRAEAQELMGLARERNKQLAHAKAEYEEYLRRYPQGRGVKRVKERLRALALATRPSRAGLGADTEESPWRVYGGASQIYRRDTSQLHNGALSTNFTSQNALLNDFDGVARRRGERFDLSMRASAGYQLDLLSDGPGDQTRVSVAFVEFGDREIDWAARAGRQSRNSGGLFGTFDGLSAGYQLLPRLRLNAAFGSPVESTRDSPETGRRFSGLSADFGTFADAWDFSLYALSQDIEGATDRQAVGTELRYFEPGRTVVALADYDIHFQDLNHALFLGTFSLPGRWTVGVNLDRRKTPSLSLRNALIGQPVAEFETLLTLFSVEDLDRLALDRTADSDLYTISISRPLGERWQWTVDASRISTGGTPASGGVDAVPETRAESAVSLQGAVSGLFGGSDFSLIELRKVTSASADTRSVGLSTRFAVGESWRISPRLRVDDSDIITDGSRQRLYVPTLRVDWQRGGLVFELETGAEIGSRDLDGAREDTTRYYLSAGYRMNF